MSLANVGRNKPGDVAATLELGTMIVQRFVEASLLMAGILAVALVARPF